MTAFSRQKCHETRAARSSSRIGSPVPVPAGSCAAHLDLGDEELGAILGATPSVVDTSTSLWSGSGGSRDALIGTMSPRWSSRRRPKRFFLVAEKDVEEAVAKGKLPSAVLEGRSCCPQDGREGVFGLHEAEPTSARGELAVLNEGDCLVLAGGAVYRRRRPRTVPR